MVCVYVQFLSSDFAANTTYTLAVLPEGYRPDHEVRVPAYASYAQGYTVIYRPDGTGTLSTTAAQYGHAMALLVFAAS